MSPPGIAIITAFVALGSQCLAQEPAELRDARRAYEEGAQTESARSRYLTKLVHMRERFARAKGNAWKAIDAQIMRHPAPPDPASLSAMMIGQWRSPRHDYIYRRDGTWSMLPVEPDTTAGTWHFEGNQCVETNVLGSFRYTTLLLTAEDYVCTDGSVVFYRKRLPR